jgi:hypothetical protein
VQLVLRSPREMKTQAPTRRVGLVAALATLLVLTVGAVRQGTLEDAVRGISADQIRSHIRFLSHDLLEGRSPGSRGGDLAAVYIAAQLERVGAAPVAGSYLHAVPLVAWRPRSMIVEAEIRGRLLPLRFPADVVLWPGSLDSENVTGEIVFAGYGTVAPEFRWDDFGDRDVRGRILLLLVNDPPAPPTEPFLFDGRAMTRYGRWDYKLEEARRRGALGAIVIHTERAGYPWDVVTTSWGRERVGLRRAEADPLRVEGWMSSDAARSLLAAGGLDYSELLVRAARRDFLPIPTGIVLRAQMAGATRRFTSPNVAGIVHGREGPRQQEIVIYTAHYDHLGIGPAVNGDSIFNGAYDNASGVAAMLEIAEAFASLRPRPDRSVLFLATTGEEAGLLGASHYTRQPLFPLQRTAAVINIDGANLWGETDDVHLIGADISTLGLVVSNRAAQMRLRVVHDRAAEQGAFFRSDHYAFARAGIPAIQIDHGLDFRGRPRGWGEQVVRRYQAEHYHRPSDRFDERADLSGAVQQSVLAFLTGYDIATAPRFPDWLENAGFSRPAAEPRRPPLRQR